MLPSDRLFRTMTDLLVSEGYARVGYEYINVDDCWLEKERSFTGQLQPDLRRFPYGMRDLSNYVSFLKIFLPSFLFFYVLCLIVFACVAKFV